MKHKFALFGTALSFSLCLANVAMSQVVIYNDENPEPYSVDGRTESRFLDRWNRHHDAKQHWSGAPASYGPDDVINLLEDRGYRVRSVQDVGPRFLVRATRDGDNLLVSVSRSGDIMGVVHDR
ncbi:hypothetical protein [Rhizobium paknamense]|uniref:PepSY domain-containing protein n=1 Tax=Rhizobium paknamense TaxID=1206817 RepID=A0ABU0IKV3_9HYPH|nr:hypothetical protein [Rhizobium paknamense]MDQ0458243.1 hypothetical protein [Rhizobium paknamense]